MRGRKSGKWVEEFEQWLADLRRETPAESPIPTSRDIAGRYGVAHTSVFRQLQRLEARGEVWKAESGRFYFPEARSAVQKPRPIACLFRRIENWSALYREIMEGIAEGCQQQELGSLLWHENVLVRHDDPAHPPVFATTARQAQSLSRFVERYGGDIGGLILDHVWTDRALARLPDELRQRAVLLCRPTATDIPAIHQDFPMTAHLALVHLLAAGYDQIHPVRPFSHDPAVDHSLKALTTAAQKGEARDRVGDVLSAETPEERAALISSLLKARNRRALVFPEDNIAALFQQECAQRGLACPEQVGILSLQGTRTAAEAQITHVRTDYTLLGRLAVQACLRLPAEVESLVPRLVQGITTRRGDRSWRCRVPFVRKGVVIPAMRVMFAATKDHVMSTENVKAFLADAKAKPELQAEVSRLKESDDLESFVAGIVRLGAEHGHAFTKEDLILASTEVPDEELEAVAGGGGIRWDGTSHSGSQNHSSSEVWEKFKSLF